MRKIYLVILIFVSCFVYGQTTFANYNHWITTDGGVYSMAQDISYLYIGGDFLHVGPPTGNFAKITTSNTNPDTNYCRTANPYGNVYSVISDGSGGWYIGGDFIGILSSSTYGYYYGKGIAHIFSNGQLDISWNPNPDGTVYSMVLSGTNLYVAGTFTNIGGQTRKYIAKLTTTGNGSADVLWNPNADGVVYSLAISGSDLYSGGNFINIGGQTRNGVAKLNATGTGNADLIWNPSTISASVKAMILSGTDLYIGGNFSNIGGQVRNNIAKLSTTGIGNADPIWNPNANWFVNSIALSGGDLYVGGDFSNIGGQMRNNIAKLTTTGAGNADPIWNPNSNGYVSTLALLGSNLYVGGNFTNIGGQIRNRIARVSTLGIGAADSTWNPNASDVVHSICLSGSDVFIGGAFQSIGRLSRNRIARFSKLTGAADVNWNPNADGHVSTLAISGSDLYVGGNFTQIGGLSRNRIAKLSTTGIGNADLFWNPNSNSWVQSIIVSSTDLFVSGVFTNIGGQNRNRIAKLSSIGTGLADPIWNPNANNSVETLLLSGNDLYIGGQFTNVGGQNRNFIAKLNALGTGTADLLWDPNANYWVRSLTLSGSDLFVGGWFTNIGGQNRNYIAKLDATGIGTADLMWNPNANWYVNSLALNGNQLYTVGAFSNIGGQTLNLVCRLNTIGTGTADFSWNPNPSGNPRCISLSGSDVYVAGSYSAIGGQLYRSGIALFGSLCTTGPSTLTLSASNFSICPGQTTTLSITSGSLNTATNWFWYNSGCGAGPIGTGTSVVVNPTITTTYYVRGEGGCAGTSALCTTIVVNVNPSPIIAINNANVCGASSNGALSATVTATPGPYTYLWSNGATVPTATNLTSGVYATTVTASNGCFASQTATVFSSPIPTISVNSGSICSGSNFTIVPTGASTYTIQGGSFVVTPTVNTSYTVTGTSTAGCLSNIATSNVSVSLSPTVSVNSGTLCSGTNFTIVPTGASSYTIQGGSTVVTPTSNSSYSVIGTTTAGCLSNVAISNVTVSSSPTISVNSGSICSGNNFTIVPSGASTYTIQGGSSIVSPSTNTSYTIAGTNTMGCLSNIATSNVSVSTSPTLSVNNGTICLGSSFTIAPTGASSYTIQGGSNVVTPISNSSYTVVGTSTAGCLGLNTATSNITVSPIPTITVNSGTICNGNTFTITPSGASVYTIQGGTSIVSPTSTANYTVSGISSFGCNSSNTATSNIVVNPSPTINAISTGSVCEGSSINLLAFGALTYTWSNGFIGPIANVTPTISTTYSVNGVNAIGCVTSQTTNVIVDNTCQDVWPGDANSDGIANNVDVLELGLHYTNTGPARAIVSNTWQAYFSNNWSGTISNGKNLNHSDCNGDGVINANDTLAINLNYGLTHSFKNQQNTWFNSQLNLVPDQAMVAKGTWGTASVLLGDNSNPINNINGLAFTVDYDPTLLEADSLWLEYVNSFIDAGQNLHFRKLAFTNGKLYAATTHTNNVNANGHGLVAKLHYKINPNLTNDLPLNLSISQGFQSDAVGVISSLTSGGASTLMAIGASVGIKEFGKNIFYVSPNPTNGILNISLDPSTSNSLPTIEILNSIGQVLKSEIIKVQNFSFNISNYPAGIYFVKATIAGQSKVVKVVKE